jgi:hypothetical protein
VHRKMDHSQFHALPSHARHRLAMPSLAPPRLAKPILA